MHLHIPAVPNPHPADAPGDPLLPPDPDKVPGRPEPVTPPQPIDPPGTAPPIQLPPNLCHIFCDAPQKALKVQIKIWFHFKS